MNPITSAAALLLAAALATSPTAFSAAATSTASSDKGHAGQPDVCKLDVKYLPRTPDAVEGWLRGCPSR